MAEKPEERRRDVTKLDQAAIETQKKPPIDTTETQEHEPPQTPTIGTRDVTELDQAAIETQKKPPIDGWKPRRMDSGKWGAVLEGEKVAELPDSDQSARDCNLAHRQQGRFLDHHHCGGRQQNRRRHPGHQCRPAARLSARPRPRAEAVGRRGGTASPPAARGASGLEGRPDGGQGGVSDGIACPVCGAVHDERARRRMLRTRWVAQLEALDEDVNSFGLGRLDSARAVPRPRVPDPGAGSPRGHR